MELDGWGRERESLVLSPTPHLRIEDDATDRSDLLFPRALTELVMEHRGYKAGWAPQGTAPLIVLRPSTPAPFFIALFDHLTVLAIKP
jgi:hypothetical protein